jgi:hypothetical protein
MTLDTLAAILILGLMTYRIARIIPVDDVAEPIRSRITLWTYPEKEISTKAAARRVWLGRLLACPVCLGWWVAGLVVLFYSLVIVDEWFGFAFLIFWPATAGVATITALWADSE